MYLSLCNLHYRIFIIIGGHFCRPDIHHLTLSHLHELQNIIHHRPCRDRQNILVSTLHHETLASYMYPCQTCIKRSPLGQGKSGPLNEFQFIRNFYDRTRKRWPFNTGDNLIEMTTWASLTVLYRSKNFHNHFYFSYKSRYCESTFLRGYQFLWFG